MEVADTFCEVAMFVLCRSDVSEGSPGKINKQVNIRIIIIYNIVMIKTLNKQVTIRVVVMNNHNNNDNNSNNK